MSHLLLATTYAPWGTGKNVLQGGDIAWTITSASLVLLMTPALAFFYGGMVRSKHVLAMLIQNFACIAIVSVTWVLIGFTWAFSGENHFLGDMHFAALRHMGDVVPTLDGAQTIPTTVFVAFQLTFAIITPALITGSTADRWKFGPFCAFVTIWSLSSTPRSPTGCSTRTAGSTASMSTATSSPRTSPVERSCTSTPAPPASRCASWLGKRRGYPTQNMRGHNIPFVLLGAGLLWFGWFGFNSGSALTASNLAGYAWLNTNTATATALIGWIAVEKIRYGKCTALGAASGAVAGLVAITPCAGWVSPFGSIFIGLIAGAVCACAISLKTKLGFDDSLDVVGVHFVGGWIGTLMVGFFSTTGTNPAGDEGIFYGGGHGHFAGWNLLWHQAAAAGAVTVFSFVGTLIIASVINLVWKNRVSRRWRTRVWTPPCTVSRPTSSDRSAAGTSAAAGPAFPWVRPGSRWTREYPDGFGARSGMKQITAVVKPFKLDDVKAAWKCSVSKASRSARCRASAGSAGTPRSTAEPSTPSTSCRRCASTSSCPTGTSRRWSGRSSRPPAPARSVTARCGSPRSRGWSACARANGTPTPSDERVSLSEVRAGVLRRPGLVGVELRLALAQAYDAWLQPLVRQRDGIALVAVGGLGRREPAPYSDLDLVLLHEGRSSISPTSPTPSGTRSGTAGSASITPCARRPRRCRSRRTT